MIPPTELRASLLTEADMPAGWASGTGTFTTTTSNTTRDLCPAARTRSLDVFGGRSGPIQAGFNRGESGPVVDEALVSRPDASTVFEAMKRSLAACVGRTWKQTENGVDATVSLKTVPIPASGDEHIAFGLSLTTFLLDLSIDLVAVRKGSTIAFFGGFGFRSIGAGVQLSQAELAAIVEKGSRSSLADAPHSEHLDTQKIWKMAPGWVAIGMSGG